MRAGTVTRRDLQARRVMRLALGALANPSIAAMLMGAAARYGVDPDLVVRLAQRESGLDPNAVSARGAKGVMQLTDATAAALGVSNPFDPAENIAAGVRYLAQLFGQFGDPVQAVAAYNWGPGRVSAAVEQHGDAWLAYAPAETQNYVRDLLGVSAPANGSGPLTIDASTGLPVEDSTDVTALRRAGELPAEQASMLPSLPVSGTVLAVGGILVGGFLLADLLRQR